MMVTNMEESIKYCEKCGKELIKGEILKYDMYTGVPICNMKCPSGLCEHTGIWHKYRGWFQRRCIECGVRFYTDDSD